MIGGHLALGFWETDIEYVSLLSVTQSSLKVTVMLLDETENLPIVTKAKTGPYMFPLSLMSNSGATTLMRLLVTSLIYGKTAVGFH